MTANPETTLVLKRNFPASRERVFNAWTDPAALKEWFHVGDDWTTSIHEVDLKVGGLYRLGMQSPDNDLPYIVRGTYLEIERPEKLVHTWSWEGEDSVETLVTVLFHDRGDFTEVELKHEKFPNSEERDKHNQGWLGCLEQFAKAV